ncbi:chaperonin 10-like protein [Scenedesmus sp. NREL 46B-D3]|nr:chaperonin 10-like protein [Scenedesmus sp. NREL 46B-D3]
MLALTFGGTEQIALATVDKPRLLQPTDVIVKVTLCGICGSDLHPYHGREAGLQPGTIVGHEFTGLVEAVGEQAAAPGDRVMSPFTTSCGACFFCGSGLTCRCSHAQGARCFGWVGEAAGGEAAAPGAGLQGSQAQYVRVPLADGTLVKVDAQRGGGSDSCCTVTIQARRDAMQVPEGVTDEECILLGDILSTAFFCADQASISLGDTAVVIGCGPVGLLAILAARQRGAATVVAVDAVPTRRLKAAEFGAMAVGISEAAAAVAAATGGRGADVALELVGSGAALGLGFELLRNGGVLSSIGVHSEPQFPFSPVDAYNKNLTYRSGRCPARRYMQQLLPLVVSKAWPFADIISHRMPLQQGVEAYKMFAERRAGVIKIVLDPWAE